MRELYIKFLHKLGLTTPEDLERSISESLGSLEHTYIDLSNTVTEYDFMYKDCVEANHRLKKLEKYLNIEYVIKDDMGSYQPIQDTKTE